MQRVRVDVRRVQPAGREDAGDEPEADAEPGDEQQAEPPLGHRVEDQRACRSRRCRTSPPRFQAPRMPEVDPDHRGQDRRGADQQQRRPQPVHGSAARPAIRYCSEIPRSPVKVFFRNVRNCCGSGCVQPVGLVERVDLLLADHPAAARGCGPGSPGSTRNRKKFTSSMKSRLPTDPSTLQPDVRARSHAPGAGPRPRLGDQPRFGDQGHRGHSAVSRTDGTGAASRSRTPPPTEQHEDHHAGADQERLPVDEESLAARRTPVTAPRSDPAAASHVLASAAGFMWT